jgi:SsrA-binding protein
MTFDKVAENKKARFDYEVIETLEAGLVLRGSEVKSLRHKQCNLKDSYISFSQGEAFLQNAHISVYAPSSYNNHDPERLRKLLLHKTELDRLFALQREKGLTIIPLKVYFKKGRAKVEIAIVRGKKKGDKRQDLKKRSSEREMQRALRRRRDE